MARSSAVTLGFLLALLLATAAAAAVRELTEQKEGFAEENPIRTVTDRAAETVEDAIIRLLGRTRHVVSFASFAQRYGKRYGSLAEIRHRFGAFVENLHLVQAHNRQRLPYTLALNEFADLTWEEFQHRSLGAAQNCSATLKGTHRMTAQVLPEEKDWRKEGIVSPIKNQGSCGSCWTFSTTGALEAAYKQLTGKDVSLSEQQLVDCARGFNNFGCQGGLPSQAFEYIKYNGGLDTEESYPYRGVNGVCHFKNENVGVKVADSVNISLGAEDELKHAVGLVRPVSVAFQVVKNFRFYKSGVYTSTTCGNQPMDVNHAVLAVGYGVEHGVPYWLIKNSWGESWGAGGYFKMEMGKNMCGVATCASYPIVTE